MRSTVLMAAMPEPNTSAPPAPSSSASADSGCRQVGLELRAVIVQRRGLVAGQVIGGGEHRLRGHRMARNRLHVDGFEAAGGITVPAGHAQSTGVSGGPSANSFRKPSSSSTGTPNSIALSYLEPGESPATT